MDKPGIMYYTAGELGSRETIPEALQVRRHLIYSSPATLAFNSPGAESFGVKRAGLAVPESVMLIVSPGCCGRNTSSLSSQARYKNRFFYLTISEADLVTGRHLQKIPAAVQQVCEALPKPPSVVMICSTCVDALLGSDMERICRKAEEAACVRVRPCYMYALTREGSRPPMVQVRQSIYGLLQPMKRHARDINLLGYFAPVAKDSELHMILRSAGVRHIRQLSECSSYEEFMEMAGANVNLVLNEEARPAAVDMQRQLGIPFIELQRLYRMEQIRKQYRALGQVLDIPVPDEAAYREAREAIDRVYAACPNTVFAVGECCNADPFELSLALLEEGFAVAEIFGVLNDRRMRLVRKISALSPYTRIYLNQSPAMTAYDGRQSRVDVCIGSDAAYYHPEALCVSWDDECQPFGYQGVSTLFRRIHAALAGGQNLPDDSQDGKIRLGQEILGEHAGMAQSPAQTAGDDGQQTIQSDPSAVKGLRLHLTPFAPDQSGAEEVLYDMKSISVILDAGGCTGNICGFDEPRWFEAQNHLTAGSAVMSAGMRDMDAVLGRDDRLLGPIREAGEVLPDAACISLIGTPVPSVIGMDYKAVGRLAKGSSDLPVLSIDTNGIDLYDTGASKAYMALLRGLPVKLPACQGAEAGQNGVKAVPDRIRTLGVFGAIPLDIGGREKAEQMKAVLKKQYGAQQIRLYGYDAGPEALMAAADADLNLVVSPSGLAAAGWLRENAGIPYRIAYPLDGSSPAEEMLAKTAGKNVLIIHQQVLAKTLAEYAAAHGAAKAMQATWFGKHEEIGDCIRLREEGDLTKLIRENTIEVIAADPVLRPLCPPGWAGTFIPLVHFAVSGRLA